VNSHRRSVLPILRLPEKRCLGLRVPMWRSASPLRASSRSRLCAARPRRPASALACQVVVASRAHANQKNTHRRVAQALLVARRPRRAAHAARRRVQPRPLQPRRRPAPPPHQVRLQRQRALQFRGIGRALTISDALTCSPSWPSCDSRRLRDLSRCKASNQPSQPPRLPDLSTTHLPALSRHLGPLGRLFRPRLLRHHELLVANPAKGRDAS